MDVPHPCHRRRRNGCPLPLVPELWGEFVDWRAVDPTITRTLGAGLLAVAVASWLGYRADAWEELRILVVFEIVFPAFTALAALYEVLLADAPAFTWVIVAVTVVFALAFGCFYRRMTAEAAETGERTVVQPVSSHVSFAACVELPPE